MDARPGAPQIDVNVPRFNQASIAVITALAFILDAPALVVVALAALVITYATRGRLGPFTQAYVRLVRPRLRPDGPVETEDARPPRFAQLIGTIVLGAAVASFALGWVMLGWALTLLVTSLATLAASTRICVGCIAWELTLGRASA